MKKILRKLIFLKFFGNAKMRLILGLLTFITITFLGYSFFNFVKAANLNYSEDFTTTTFKNSLYTTANWLGTGLVNLSKAFVKVDGTKGYIDNVSSDQENSIYPLIFLDNKNQPFMAWESTPSGLNSEIYFTKGNLMTLNWEQMNGIAGRDNVSHTIGTSNIDRVAMASDGNPFIVWQDNTLPGLDGIYGNGDDVQGTVNDYSILFSQWNFNGCAGLGCWSKMDGSPGIEKISNNAVGFPSKLPRIALDISDRPYVVWDQYLSPTNNEIYFTRWDGTKWAKMDGTAGVENLSNNLGESSFPRILLTSNNRPQVMWEDATPGNNDIFFSKWAFNVGAGVCGPGIVSCWTNMAGTTAGNENISNTAGNSNYDRQFDSNFVIGHDNFPYIAWRDNTGSAFYNLYFSHWSGTAWSSMDGLSSADILNTGATATRLQLALDTGDNPQIAWIALVAPNKLYFSRWNPGAGQWEALDGTPGMQIIDAVSSSFPTIAIDSANNLFISWLRGNPKNVAAVKSTGSNWTKLDGTAGFSDVSGTTPWANNRPQMVLASNGNLFFTWETGTGTINPEIWATYWDNDLQTFRVIREGQEQSAGIVGENHWTASDIKTNFDSANQPFIVWADACLAGTASLDVCLTHWDGTNWVRMDGTPGTDQVSDFLGTSNGVVPTLIFDSTGTKPYLAWDSRDPGVDKLYFSRWDGANFVAMDGTPGYENIANSSFSLLTGYSTGKFLSLDSADNPYVIKAGNLIPAVNDEIYFTKWTANPVTCAPAAACWTNMAGDTVGFENISNDAPASTLPVLILGTTDTPYTLWRSQNPAITYDVLFSKWTPGAAPAVCGGIINDCWTNMAGTMAGSEKINTLSTNQIMGTFVLDSGNNPYVIWTENGVRFTKWSGANGWTGMDGLGDGNPLTIDSDLIAATVSDSFGAIKLDSLNNPSAITSRSSGYSRDVMFTHWDGSQWATMAGTAGLENISNNTGNSVGPILFFDSTNKPVIFWSDDSETLYAADYFFTHWNGMAWVNMRDENGYTNISRNSGAMNSYNFDVAKDNNDDFYVGFNRQEPGATNLYFSRTGIPVNYYRTAQSLNVYSGSDSVTQATLSSAIDNNGGPVTIKYFFSNDGGYIWEPATVGVPINFNSNPTLEWRARLKTANTLVIPTITGLSIDYVTAAAVIGGGNPPSAPLNLTCQAQSPNTIRWNFEDTASNETGFRLYGPDGFIFEDGRADLSYVDETNLSVNTQYKDKYVTAFNATGESGQSNTDTVGCYTLANTPSEPQIGEVTQDSITVMINPGDNNPANTEYAIKELNSDKYVQLHGTFGDLEDWQTYDGWNGLDGIKVTGESAAANLNAQFKISLASGQTYNFAAKARNGDGVETAFSGGTGGTTQSQAGAQPIIIASKGVAINLAQNSEQSLVAAANASSNLTTSLSGGSRFTLLIREFSFFLNIILVILVGLLIISLAGLIKHLPKDTKIKTKIKLLWQALSREPAVIFSELASRDNNGTFQSSYEKHRHLQTFAQKTLQKTVGIIGLKIIILLVLFGGLAGVYHLGGAQNAPYNQSGLEVSVNDKLSYIIEFANQGAAAAANMVVTDNLNNNLSLVAGSAKISINGQETTLGITINGNNLSFNIGDLAASQIGSVYFSARVKTGTEGQTILNQAQVSGSNFASLQTNATDNLVKEEIQSLCGNSQIDANEQCDPGATPNGCNKNQRCAGCQCQTIIAAVCGNGKIEAGESCDPGATPTGCGVGQTCANCQCQPEVVIPPPVTPPPVIPPPVTPPLTLPPTPPTTPPLLPIPGIVKSIEQGFFNNHQIEQISQNIIIPLLLLIALLNTIPGILAIILNILPYLHLLFVEPLMYLFRKRREKWGVIYDALSKLPVDLAVVRLYNKADNKLIQTRISDKNGRYLMIAKEPGKYYLSVTRPGYAYPTRYLKEEKQDIKYLDLYHGEEIEVKDKEGVITVNIPVDPLEKKLMPTKQVIFNYIISNIRLLVSYTGIILALLIVLIYPTIFTIGALILHLILFLIFRRLVVPPKPKSWGIVYDQINKEPLHYAIIRIFETKFNKLLETQVTDHKGRYAFLVGKNVYQLLTEKTGYQKKEVKPVDLTQKDEIVNLDINLNKVV